LKRERGEEKGRGRVSRGDEEKGRGEEKEEEGKGREGRGGVRRREE